MFFEMEFVVVESRVNDIFCHSTTVKLVSWNYDSSWLDVSNEDHQFIRIFIIINQPDGCLLYVERLFALLSIKLKTR